MRKRVRNVYVFRQSFHFSHHPLLVGSAFLQKGRKVNAFRHRQYKRDREQIWREGGGGGDGEYEEGGKKKSCTVELGYNVGVQQAKS